MLRIGFEPLFGGRLELTLRVEGSGPAALDALRVEPGEND